MLKGRLAIEAAEEISDPKRGWICDLFDPLFETDLPHVSRLIDPSSGRAGMTAPHEDDLVDWLSGFWRKG